MSQGNSDPRVNLDKKIALAVLCIHKVGQYIRSNDDVFTQKELVEAREKLQKTVEATTNESGMRRFTL